VIGAGIGRDGSDVAARRLPRRGDCSFVPSQLQQGPSMAGSASSTPKSQGASAPGFQHEPDRPWIFRTYAGHSTAEESNKLYRKNLSKGQTGLSIAFDLPTQTAYDSDHILAKGEVGKVGVPVGHLGDMRALFDGIPLAEMNTSMTINAPAAWLLALYVALA